MPLEKWELSHYPSDKDKHRWRLKLKVPEKELVPLINIVPGTRGRPFQLLEDPDYDFELFIYEVKDSELADLKKVLAEKCGKGLVAGPPVESNIDDIIEKVVKGLENVVPGKGPAAFSPPKQEMPQAKKIEEPPAPRPEEQPRREVQTPQAPPASPKEPVRKDAVETSAPPAPPVPGKGIGFGELGINARYTFEEFIIGPNNRFTAAAAQAVADNPGKIYNPFFIYGGVGLGKTHMMHAVGHYVRRKNPNLKIMYVTTEKFMSEVIDSIRKGTPQQMRDYYRQIDLLLIDDIQFLVESESTQEEFFHTFNILHQNGKQIIITSDRPPKQLTTLEDRLRSRFEWGLIADIKSPNLETRVAILKKKGECEHVKLDDNILLYIASKLKSNIRELEGFLKRINAYASLTHQEVNMELVRNLMSDLLPAGEGGEEEAPQPKPAPAAKPVYQEPAQEPAPEVIPQKPAVPPGEVVAEQVVPEIEMILTREPAAPAPAPAPAPAKTERPSILKAPKVEPPQPAPEAPPPKPAAPAPSKPAAKPVVQETEGGLKSVEVAFFYPEGKEQELTAVKGHFQEIIKKHKLKFKFEAIVERSYSFTGKINYAFFSEICKTNNVTIAIVLGPPPEATVTAEDFANLLSSIMDDEKVSLQLVPWLEINKDYRYLNLSLDITLLKHKL